MIGGTRRFRPQRSTEERRRTQFGAHGQTQRFGIRRRSGGRIPTVGRVVDFSESRLVRQRYDVLPPKPGEVDGTNGTNGTNGTVPKDGAARTAARAKAASKG